MVCHIVNKKQCEIRYAEVWHAPVLSGYTIGLPLLLDVSGGSENTMNL